MSRVVISGWYGFGNIGDELILEAIIQNLRAVDEKTEIIVMSFNPDYTRRVQGVETVRQIPITFKSMAKNIVLGRAFQAVKVIKECDLFIMGGGGFLSDWQREVPFGWLKQMAIAKSFNRKTILYGIGAGPFRTYMGKFITHTFINKYVDKVLTRDETSTKELMNCGVHSSIILQGMDPVFNIVSKKNAIGRNKVIGINLIELFNNTKLWKDTNKKYEIYEASIAKLILSIQEKYKDYSIKYFPFMSSDMKFMELLMKKYGIENIVIEKKVLEDILLAPELINNCEVFIGMRFHSLLLALASNVPTFSLIYHHKSNCLVEAYDMKYYSDFITDNEQSALGDMNLNIEHCISRIEELFINLESIKEKLDSHRRHFASSIELNINILKDFLKVEEYR